MNLKSAMGLQAGGPGSGPRPGGGSAEPQSIQNRVQKFGNRAYAESSAKTRSQNGEDVTVVSVNGTEHHVVPSSYVQRFGPVSSRDQLHPRILPKRL
jgi:hypothetical protein